MLLNRKKKYAKMPRKSPNPKHISCIRVAAIKLDFLLTKVRRLRLLLRSKVITPFNIEARTLALNYLTL
jgi:hypothetical protein